MLGNVDFPVLVRMDELANAFRPDTLVDAVAVLLVLVGCGAGYRHVKNRPPKYQAVSLDEEIPLNDFSIDAPGRSEDGDGMLARRDNPSYGAGRPGAGKAR